MNDIKTDFKLPSSVINGDNYDTYMKVMARALNYSIIRLRSHVKVDNPFDMVELDDKSQGIGTTYFEIYFEDYNGNVLDALPFVPLTGWFELNYHNIVKHIMFKNEVDAALVITDIFRHCVKQYRNLQEKNVRETEIRDDFIDPNTLPHVKD